MRRSIIPVSPQKPRKRLYNIGEGGEYLGRTVPGVRELIYRGELPVVRSGPRGKIWLDVEDLDRWIDARKGTE
jgi:hypothetical protein